MFMKLKKLIFSVLVAGAWSSLVQAQIVLETDPTIPLNDYVSLGEFETPGALDGWNSAGGGANPRLLVANGALKITTTAGDPWFFRAGLQGIAPEFTIAEVRLKKVSGSSSNWELFYGLTGAGGFSGARRLGYALPDDNEYHILHFNMTEALGGGSLTDFRIDAGDGAGNVAEIDYVRIGRIAPDTDADGLPDSVETKTGIYVDARNTGSDPAKADTDGDKVDDGTEVRFGTDPNNKDKFPVPSIKYPISEAIYIVTVKLVANTPTVNLGNATSFSVAPPLPAGLTLNGNSGLISGTPTVVSEGKDYVVTANFPGGITAAATVRIEVRAPFIEFAVDRFSFPPGAKIAAFALVASGPAPKSLTIAPSLPTGLAFDSTTGEISGTPEAYSAVRAYTVTATYTGHPNATTAVNISVLETPTFSLDPAEALLGFESLGEFNDDSDLANFNIRNGLAALTIADGALQVQTTGGDPFFGRTISLGTDYRILEFRMKITEGSPSPMRFYWAENTDGRRNLAELTAHSITELATDGEFHVYRVDFRQATEGSFSVLRIDPGNGEGSSLQLDYLRLGGFTPTLSIATEAGGKLRLSWPAAVTQSGYKLQSTTSIGANWTADATAVETAGNRSSVVITGDGSARLFRLAK